MLTKEMTLEELRDYLMDFYHSCSLKFLITKFINLWTKNAENTPSMKGYLERHTKEELEKEMLQEILRKKTIVIFLTDLANLDVQFNLKEIEKQFNIRRKNE